MGSARARLALALGLACVVAVSPGAHAQSRVGDRAPEIGLPDLNGEPVTLAGLRGHVVLVDVWGSWCDPCRHEFPVLERLYRRYRARGLVVVGLSQDSDPSLVDGFLARNPVTFPIVQDAAHTVAPRYDPDTMPSAWLIDRRGIVRFYHRGFNAARDPASLDTEIRSLLLLR